MDRVVDQRKNAKKIMASPTQKTPNVGEANESMQSPSSSTPRNPILERARNRIMSIKNPDSASTNSDLTTEKKDVNEL